MYEKSVVFAYDPRRNQRLKQHAFDRSATENFTGQLESFISLSNIYHRVQSYSKSHNFIFNVVEKNVTQTNIGRKYCVFLLF